MFVCPECGASQPHAAVCPADRTPLAPVGDDLILGTTIGAYRVARLLGMGGMGRVYKGVQPQIGSRVAIKVLSRECSDRRDLVDRFFSEAKAVNLIRHESIVNVLDLSMLPDGRPYIVMEYLDGAPLASIIDQAQHRGRLPLGGVARLIAEILDALGAAHAKGIIHRDLKPDNIFVTPGGRAKVLDFGIAKLQPELGGSSTHTGSLMGTPHYMSPEQAAGRAVDQRADLYAIGVILFECSTLQKPFTAPSLFDLLRQHVEAPPPSPRALRPDMPPELEHVIYTALAKHPEQRFDSSQAMSMALQHATARLAQDQWAPITPSASNRPPSAGGWAPTPPASWAGSGRDHAPSIATATAGQVTAPVPRSSRKGIWIALAALVVVGGGVTAAVVAGGGDEARPVSSGSAIASGIVVAPVPVPTPPVPIPTPAPPAPPTDLDLDSDSDTAALDAMIQQQLDQLPPDARAMLPAGMRNALKKYGTWAKVPKAERGKLASELTGTMGALTMAAGMDINSALAGDPPPPSGPKAAIGPDGWVMNTPLAPIGAFDPKHLDAQAYLPYALKQAKLIVPDAELFRIDAVGILPDGHADITVVDNGMLDYRFISPSRSKRDPKLPIGAKQEWKCMFRIMIEKDGAKVRPMTGWDCKEKLLPSPRCSLAAVWTKALAKKAPKNGIASLGYRASSDGIATWYFQIADADAPFSALFPDDC